MKKVILVFILILTPFFYAMPQTDKKESLRPDPIIYNSDLMTPEILWSFGRVGDVSVSPDNTTVLFSVRYFSIKNNKGQSDFYTMPAGGGNVKRITDTPQGKYSPQWRPDGKKIGFVSGGQLWEMNPDGSEQKQVSKTEGGINDFKYSPDMAKILFIRDVKIDKNVQDMYPDLPKANARIETDLMYRHWDTWHDYTYSHIFVADYSANGISGELDIMSGERFDSPLKPFGGMEQINWSPDSKSVAFTCKKQTGKQYAVSTNSDIFVYNIATRQTINISEGMPGFDVAPVYSPDGKKIVWLSMERDGYESDKNRLIIFDFETKVKTYATKDLDQNAEGQVWTSDGKSIYFISGVRATEEIYRYDIADGKIIRVTDGQHNYLSVAPAGNVMIALKQSISKPTEVYSVNPLDGKDTELSFINKPILEKLTFGDVTKRMVKTTDDKDMLAWVIYPPHFDKTKKYPTLLFCEGGPQSTVNQFWSFRWNFQMMAANGYIIIAPNRRGLPSFGMEWLEQISGDYGGQNMKDYLSAIDDISKEPYVDKDKLGAVGASYGGYSVYWLAGNHEKRFKAFIAHDGMFNLESQYLETEEMWFVDWDLGGPFWDKSNERAQKSYNNFSPHKFVQNWDTPILIIHGEKDYRIAFTQGMSAFNAAVLKGVPAEFLFFPDENHWVLQPQDGILWQRTYFKWLDKWLK